MLAQRLKVITYGQTLAQGYDKMRGRNFAADIVAELWMIPIERFSGDDVTLFYRTAEYVQYSYGLAEEPEWLQDDDISRDW